MGLERCMPLCLAIRLDIALDISTPGAPGKKKINTCVRHTPAGAGNTSAHMPGCVSIWTHPRLHGEYTSQAGTILAALWIWIQLTHSPSLYTFLPHVSMAI